MEIRKICMPFVDAELYVLYRRGEQNILYKQFIYISEDSRNVFMHVYSSGFSRFRNAKNFYEIRSFGLITSQKQV